MKVSFGAWTICALTGITSAAICAVLYFIASVRDLHDMMLFFQDHLREPLFIGLLTVATFLFSLKTFIIVTMNDKVYSTEAYGKEWTKKRN